MLDFIKLFFQGLLYTILSPFLLAYFCLFLIYSVVNYLVLEVVNFVLFFFGSDVSSDTKLERKIKNRLKLKEELSIKLNLESFKNDETISEKIENTIVGRGNYE